MLVFVILVSIWPVLTELTDSERRIIAVLHILLVLPGALLISRSLIAWGKAGATASGVMFTALGLHAASLYLPAIAERTYFIEVVNVSYGYSVYSQSLVWLVGSYGIPWWAANLVFPLFAALHVAPRLLLVAAASLLGLVAWLPVLDSSHSLYEYQIKELLVGYYVWASAITIASSSIVVSSAVVQRSRT